MISVPYGLDLNDSVTYAIEKLSMLEMKLRIEQIRDCHARSVGSLIWAVPDWQ
jgi:allantoinase